MLPERAIIYCRISDARSPDPETGARVVTTAGVDDQLRRCRLLADALGWGTGPEQTHILVENDLTAFKRRKVRLPGGRSELRVVRPRFRLALDMLDDGRADGFIALDLDRTVRDPRDLEDLADVVRAKSIPCESVSGSLRLLTDGDLTMARVLVAMANKSSLDTSRRVSAARQRQALEGRFGGGHRPYGFDPDGLTVRPAEAAAVTEMARMVIAGASLREIAAELREQGAPCTDGGKWTPVLVRQILMRPRNAGLTAYKGKEAGPALWEPVLPEEQWRGVVAILSDPSRLSPVPGRAPRWLLSNIARCGVCGGFVSQCGGSGQHPRYRCREHNGHVSRAARPADDLVTQVVVGRLAMPDAVRLIAAPGRADTGNLVSAAAAARERMSALTGMYGAGTLTLAAFRNGYNTAESELRRLEAEIAAVAPDDVLLPIAGRSDAADVWDQLDVARRRAVVRVLVEVTFVSGGKGGRRPGGGYFRPESVRIEWKQDAGGRNLRAVT